MFFLSFDSLVCAMQRPRILVCSSTLLQTKSIVPRRQVTRRRSSLIIGVRFYLKRRTKKKYYFSPLDCCPNEKIITFFFCMCSHDDTAQRACVAQSSLAIAHRTSQLDRSSAQMNRSRRMCVFKFSLVCFLSFTSSFITGKERFFFRLHNLQRLVIGCSIEL